MRSSSGSGPDSGCQASDEGVRRSGREPVVLLRRSPADPDGAEQPAAAVQRDASGEEEQRAAVTRASASWMVSGATAVEAVLMELLLIVVWGGSVADAQCRTRTATGAGLFPATIRPSAPAVRRSSRLEITASTRAEAARTAPTQLGAV